MADPEIYEMKAMYNSPGYRMLSGMHIQKNVMMTAGSSRLVLYGT